MDVEIIIPFRGIDPQRRRVLAWLESRFPHPYALALDDCMDTWSKGRVLWPMVKRAHADILVIHDADVWCPNLEPAIEAVRNGSVWARPHGFVYRLTEFATASVLAGEKWSGKPMERAPYYGMSGGGIVVARREVFQDIPLDPRFEGWGQEDESWAMALWCLTGKPFQGDAPLVHLWHSQAPRLDRRVGSETSWHLRNRYARARRHPDLMRPLVEEARVCLESPYTTSNDCSASGVG